MSPTSLYASVYRAFPDPQYGRKHPRTLTESLNRPLNTLAGLLWKGTYVLFCTFDGSSRRNATDCRVVAQGFSMANGISTDHHAHVVLVVDAVKHKVRVFNRSASSEDGELLHWYDVELQYAADNIEYHHASNSWYLGSILNLRAALQHSEAFLPGMNSPGGVQRLWFEPSTSSFQSEVLLAHSGRKLSGVSCAVPFGSKLAMGSWSEDGILLCPSPS